MTRLKLLTSVASVAAIAWCGGASAQVTTQIYGGGAALLAPSLRQIGDCFGNPADLVNQNSATTAATLVPYPPFTYSGVEAPYTAALRPPAGGYNCAATTASPAGSGPVNPTLQLNYISAGSGNGGATFFSHNTTTFWGDVTGLGGVPGAGSTYPDVHFAVSEAALGVTDVEIYNTGGIDTNFKNVSIAGPGYTGTGTGAYPTPAPLYGPAIQVPLLITPLVFAFDPIYKKVSSSSGTVTTYSFNIHDANSDGSGGLVLDVPTLCNIVNGNITNWNDPAIRVLNDNVSLRSTADPEPEGTPTTPGTWEYTGTGGGLAIQLVGRSDSAGATALLTRSMAAQCAGITNNVTNYPNGSLYLNSTVENNSVSGGKVTTPGFVAQPGKFGLANLMSGAAAYISFTATPSTGATLTGGKLGYLSPDYVWPNVQFSTANSGYHLDVVDIRRQNTTTGAYHRIEPTAANALLAFNLLPPQSNAAGAYEASVTTNGQRSNPADWALPITTTYYLDGATTATNNPLAFAPSNSAAYPFVGTADGFFYTCYNETATPGITAAVIDFLKFYFSNPIVTDTKKGVLARGGFAPMPTAWKNAILDTFVTPVSTGATASRTKALNLNILAGGTAGTGTGGAIGNQCATITGA